MDWTWQMPEPANDKSAMLVGQDEPTSINFNIGCI
jgi:hypothetical protein